MHANDKVDKDIEELTCKVTHEWEIQSRVVRNVAIIALVIIAEFTIAAEHGYATCTCACVYTRTRARTRYFAELRGSNYQSAIMFRKR